MNPVAFRALQLAQSVRYRRFFAESLHVRAAQEATLERLVARLGGTRLARRLGASSVTRLAELQRRVPLVEYDDLRAEVEASLRGEPDVMVRGRPELFGITAGTTSAHKYIPIDAAYRRDFQKPMHVFLYCSGRDHPRAYAGKILYFVSAGEVGRSPGGIPMGYISGYNFQRTPKPIRRMYAAPYEAFAIGDVHARMYTIALLALRHEVSSAVAVTTQPLFQFGRTMQQHADPLLRDLAAGTLTPPGPLTTAERAALAPHLERAPARAQELARRAARSGALTPASAWPSFALVSCWFHASAGAFADELPALYGNVPRRSIVYSATEGWINIPIADETASGVLALGANVLEFIPLDGHGQLAGDPLLADALEEGGRYSLVITSGAGLWRYMLRDEVECTGFFRRAPLVRFVQKVGNVLSLGHDLTSEHHVRAAVEAVRAEGLSLSRYCFGPRPGVPPRYGLVVRDAPRLDGATAGERIDAALARANPLYGSWRQRGALAPLELHVRSAAAFERFDASQRRADAQSKPLEFIKRADLLAALVDGEPAAGGGVARGS